MRLGDQFEMGDEEAAFVMTVVCICMVLAAAIGGSAAKKLLTPEHCDHCMLAPLEGKL